LLKGAGVFDRGSLAEIYDRYSPGLYRYAIRLLGDSDQAEECVAETFSRFLGAIKRGGGPREHLQAYLYRIAHNWVTDQYRSQTALPLDPEYEIEADPDSAPQTSGSDVFLEDQVRRALMQVTPDQRQVIVLKFLEGWNSAEIAKAMKKSVGAVKSLQHRALASLNRLLTEYYE